MKPLQKEQATCERRDQATLPLFSELRQAVADRLNIVADHAMRDRDPEGQLAKLKAAATRLDVLIARLPADCDPALRHYMERQSYPKALAWLEEQGND